MSSFSVDSSSLKAGTWTHVLRGSKNATVRRIIIDDDADRAYYPTSTTWAIDVVLSPGDNTFSLQAEDAAGNKSEKIPVTVTLGSSVPVPDETMCDITKHALFQGLSRLPGEKNFYFQRRVTDAPYYPSNTTNDGLVEAISRDLGLDVARYALSVAIARDTYKEPVATRVTLEVTPTDIYVDADELVIYDEQHQVDPATREFTLSYEPRMEEDVRVYTRDGNLVDKDEYRVFLADKKVRFETDEYDRDWVTVTYNYRYKVSKAGTLSDIKFALEAISVRNTQVLTVAVDDGTRSALGLCNRARLSITTDTIYIKWARIQIYALFDRGFRESLLNTYGGAYGTLLESWAEEITDTAKLSWKGAVLDVDLWDPLHKKRDMGALPHLYDSHRGYWKCSDPSDTTRYTRSDYVGYNGKCPNHPSETLEYVGVDDTEWQSGIGYGSDVLVTGIDTQ